MKILRHTESVCPHCLKTIPAEIHENKGEVYMHKCCPNHGSFDVYIWPDAEQYARYGGLDFPKSPRTPQTASRDCCPRDCGLCSRHKQRITLPEIEVTWRCNASCPVCFMAAGGTPADPSIADITAMYKTIRKYDGPDLPIQITGGEPTVREDLPEIIATGRALGFSAVELNTNGLVIGRDIDYLKQLRDAGLTNVYLQFDGLNPNATKALRGRNVLPVKKQAIENCRSLGIAVVLSVTVVQGINEGEMGDLVNFCMHNLDVVHGLALQPAFVSGRFDVPNRRHLSVMDVSRLIADQTKGKVRAEDFLPVGSSHPLCYGSTFLLGQKEDYVPFTRDLSEADYRRMFDSKSPQGAVFMDIVDQAFSRQGEAPTGLPILIMEYMDAWTMDLARAAECNLAVTTVEGKSIPFCVYHLSDINGRRLYPYGGRRPNGHHS